MKRIQTQMKGMTTVSTYDDGDMYSIVNLRRKGGTLHPVSPKAIKKTLMPPYGLETIEKEKSLYDLYFIHKNYDYQHWIGVKWGEETSTIYWDIDAESQSLIKLMSADIVGRINTIEQNGNMLVFACDETLYYAMYKENTYLFYGELPDLIPIEWNCLEEIERSSSMSAYGGLIRVDTIIEVITSLINDIRNSMSKNHLPSGSMYDEKIGGFGGVFFDAFFVRYAYRLYDDTNVKFSPPILIMPSKDILDLLHLTLAIVKTTVEEKTWFLGDSKITTTDDILGWASAIHQTGFIPGIKYDLSVISQYEEIIKGIDIFISPYIGISSAMNVDTRLRMVESPSGELLITTERLIEKMQDSMIRSARDMSSFYLVKKLKVGETTGGVYEPFPSNLDTETIENIKNLLSKEKMEEDMTIHKIGARKTYMYNRRLHLADTTTTYYGGYSMPFFSWDGQTSGLYRYNNSPAITYSTPYWEVGDECIIEVEIKNGMDAGVVYSSHVIKNNTAGVFSSMLSYPDSCGKRMTFYRKVKSNGKTYKLRSFELEEHNFLNLSYYINDEMKSIFIGPNGGELVEDIDTTILYKKRNTSEFLVSETWNPMRILHKNSYVIGQRRICGLGANVIDTSTRSYGTFPLFVLCEDGVYTLRVGEGDVAYSVVIQPALLETVVSDVMCQVPRGLVFASSRGLYMINGQSVEYLTSSVEEKPVKLDVERFPQLDYMMHNYGGEHFLEFISEMREMIYSSTTNELILIGKRYNWSLSLEDGMMYVNTERVEQVVRNTMPELLVISGRKILDYSREEGDAHISFITRPLRYSTDDIKMLERIIMRGSLYGLKDAIGTLGTLGTVGTLGTEGTEGTIWTMMKPVYAIHHSNDGRIFRASVGRTIKNGNIKDIDSGLIAREKFRYYIYSFAAICSQETIIEYIETEIIKEYKSTKMR